MCWGTKGNPGGFPSSPFCESINTHIHILDPSEIQWIEINFAPLRPTGFGNFHGACVHPWCQPMGQVVPLAMFFYISEKVKTLTCCYVWWEQRPWRHQHRRVWRLLASHRRRRSAPCVLPAEIFICIRINFHIHCRAYYICIQWELLAQFYGSTFINFDVIY